jgi:hypothetical protein
VLIGAALGLGGDMPVAVTGSLMVVFGAAVGGHVWLDVPTNADRVSSASTNLRADRTAALAYTLSFA